MKDEVLGEEIDFDLKLKCEDLVKLCHECKTKIKTSKSNKFTLKIVDLIIQGKRDIDITKQINCTRQLVSNVRKKFVSILKNEMTEQGYCI